MATDSACRHSVTQGISFSSSKRPRPEAICLGALLSHSHYAPASLEVNFIHQAFHQVDAAAMRRLELPRGGWVRELGAAKSRTFVLDHDGNFLVGHTAAVDVDLLAGIFMIAVDDAVCQGFSQGDFNVNFVSGNTLAFLYEHHELVYER
jgi:hypothetical protein